MYKLEDVVVATMPIASVELEVFLIHEKTKGVIHDWEMAEGTIFYTIDFELAPNRTIRAVARDHQIMYEDAVQKGPLPN